MFASKRVSIGWSSFIFYQRNIIGSYLARYEFVLYPKLLYRRDALFRNECRRRRALEFEC